MTNVEDKVIEVDMEEFERNLQDQKNKVDEKINPILQSYKRGEIDKKELVEKLSDTFYALEE